MNTSHISVIYIINSYLIHVKIHVYLYTYIYDYLLSAFRIFHFIDDTLFFKLYCDSKVIIPSGLLSMPLTMFAFDFLSLFVFSLCDFLLCNSFLFHFFSMLGQVTFQLFSCLTIFSLIFLFFCRFSFSSRRTMPSSISLRL